jgi:hypothetical protein
MSARRPAILTRVYFAVFLCTARKIPERLKSGHDRCPAYRLQFVTLCFDALYSKLLTALFRKPLVQ